jgi:uncharacterized cupin superfamily protein
MTHHHVTQTTVDAIEWAPMVAVKAEDVISGTPETSTVMLAEGGTSEHGFWRVTPGVFKWTPKTFDESIHILEGSGRLIQDDGTVTELRPGVVAFIPNLWVGRWEIDSTLSKVFSIINVS